MQKLKKIYGKILTVFLLVAFQNCHYIMGKPKSYFPKELAECKTCHDPNQNHNELVVGKPPGLKGIFNTMPIGDHFPFTHWTEKNLDAWLKDPKAVKDDSTMEYKVTDDRKRKEIIEALKSY